MLVGFGDRLGALGAAIFMAFIGLSFVLIYALHPEFWWAIIPAGSLFSVAVLIGLSDRIKGEVAVGIMFLGLALTFALVYVLPGRAEERRLGVDPGRHPGGDRRVHDANLGRADQLPLGHSR